ncbi:hypothetical protein VU05_05420 [Desulfobulbus sp. F1]|nr:hypothetical protein [Desulfobulbus sp. F1]
MFIVKADGQPQGLDDALQAQVFRRDTLPPLAFDHAHILDDYFSDRY